MAPIKPDILLCKTNVGTMIVARKRPTIDAILEREGLPSGSYAAELAERFHHFLIGRAIDVKKEYSEYYASEYCDLKQFLYQKYCLSAEWLKQLGVALEGDAFVGLVRSAWGRDWQIENLIEYDDEFDVVANTLGAHWVENPNED